MHTDTEERKYAYWTMCDAVSYSVLFVRISNLGKSYESCDMLLLALQYFMIPVN